MFLARFVPLLLVLVLDYVLLLLLLLRLVLRLRLLRLVARLPLRAVAVLLLIAQALAALNEYHAAVSETSVTIRNKPAYLMGILRKYKQGQRAPLGNGTGGGMATAPNAMGRMGVRDGSSHWF